MGGWVGVKGWRCEGCWAGYLYVDVGTAAADCRRRK